MGQERRDYSAPLSSRSEKSGDDDDDRFISLRAGDDRQSTCFNFYLPFSVPCMG